jgi:hypothetical protein
MYVASIALIYKKKACSFCALFLGVVGASHSSLKEKGGERQKEKPKQVEVGCHHPAEEEEGK